ncbi:T9SS type A sorting domain-containing protein [Winogradskyella sp. DF17]|uniref:T9SS type A sorting domain-containing protein n=1 Tax=Winogradskyella pelagia TaxID=2819984 RepID=A0ABS3T3I8_9FLAO|nr:T9SS type A sorting domain-containing protein [Winogradskyella sp. DF17]MBO3116441.1 T9SS type A sorting domain-containing protein [Winogradskyella sp. DF17]
MKKKLIGCFLVGLLAILQVSAQETFKVMFYNLLNYPLEDAVPNRETDLAFVLSDYQPDVFMVCELNNITGANAVLDIARTSINSNYEMATYVSNTSDDLGSNQNDLQNLLYYDSSKFILEEEIIVPTDLRDFNVYKLKLNTVNQDTNPIEFYAVVCHLKASNGTENQLRRFNMVVELDNYLNTLPQDAMVLLGGDLNLYTASEPAFQELLDVTNYITFADPSNRVGSWSNNPNFVDVFTQSTRTQFGLGGTAGGFDDRFDFILTSENMLASADVTYVADSYQVYGNNGLSACYNSAINSSACAIPSSQFSFEIRDALHNFSDHLPVTVELETDATLLGIDDRTLNQVAFLRETLVDNKLTLLNTDFKLSNRNIVIYNGLGQRVMDVEFNTENQKTIDVAHLESGMYFALIEKSAIVPVKFFVK